MRDKLRGFSRLEMLAVVALLGVIVALGAPMLKTGRIPVNAGEREAVRKLETVVQAQTRYRARFGKYAPSLERLGIHENEAYLCAMVLTRAGYSVTAVPRIYLINGRRTFYVNQDGVIRESRGERPASEESAEFP